MNALWVLGGIAAVTAVAVWLGWRQWHSRLRGLDEK